MRKLKIYLDSGADITGIEDLHSDCHFFHVPYDDSSNRRKNLECPPAPISKAQWRDMNLPWCEWTTSWEENNGSEYLSNIQCIIGKGHRRDALHLDSAYKARVDCFLTGDKKDIWANRSQLEILLGFRIFYPSSEKEELRNFIIQTLRGGVTPT